MASGDNTTRVVDPPAPVTVDGRPVVLWCRDTVSCLQSTLATVLRHAGWDPLEALGPRFEFRYVPGDRPREEFYYPCGTSTLGERLFARHDIAVRWRSDRRDGGLDVLRGALAEGCLPIAAVDNFHLPFRPAYHDVHAAHLVVVCGVDTSTVTVSDAMPPAFQGTVAREQFLASWHSDNPADDEDVFFSGGQPMAGRWLDVRPGPPPGPATGDDVRRAVERNVEDFRAPGEAGAGGRGLDRYRADFAEAVASGDADGALAGVYTFGWPLQAQASLHAEWLRGHARAGGDWRLAEVAAAVERVCSAWTPVRLGAAHHRSDARARQADLVAALDRLGRAYADAVTEMERLLDPPGGRAHASHREPRPARVESLT